MNWIYETGIEDPEILGSGSQYFNVVTTYDEKEAFELAKTGNRTYLERICFKDGEKITEWYDFLDNSWRKEY